MEVSIFPAPSVREQKQKFVEARLHNDAKDPLLRERIAGLIETVAGTISQPIYVAMDPVTEREIGRFNGATLGNPVPFAAFLEEMAEEIGVGVVAARPVADRGR